VDGIGFLVEDWAVSSAVWTQAGFIRFPILAGVAQFAV
jgi:hypothetical protein